MHVKICDLLASTRHVIVGEPYGTAAIDARLRNPAMVLMLRTAEHVAVEIDLYRAEQIGQAAAPPAR
jgi:hypothetical protein